MDRLVACGLEQQILELLDLDQQGLVRSPISAQGFQGRAYLVSKCYPQGIVHVVALGVVNFETAELLVKSRCTGIGTWVLILGSPMARRRVGRTARTKLFDNALKTSEPFRDLGGNAMPGFFWCPAVARGVHTVGSGPQAVGTLRGATVAFDPALTTEVTGSHMAMRQGRGRGGCHSVIRAGAGQGEVRIES